MLRSCPQPALVGKVYKLGRCVGPFADFHISWGSSFSSRINWRFVLRELRRAAQTHLKA